jgi:diguanylate cyclase (GGDEF)-like protein
VQVASRLHQAVGHHDTIARFGGDEFVVVCEDTDHKAALLIAERIRNSSRMPMTGVPPTFRVTASIGVALHQPRSGKPSTPVRSCGAPTPPCTRRRGV